MSSLCLYFHAHQSIRLREFSLRDINRGAGYEDKAANLAEFNSLLDSRCLPLNRRLLELLPSYRGALRAGISLSGTFLEMLEKHRPAEVESFSALAETGMVEFLGENYFRSFSFLFAEEEFLAQVKLHKKKVKALFGCPPVTFRNTEGLYSNRLAQCIEQLGFKTLLNETALNKKGIDKGGIYRPADSRKLIFIQGGKEEGLPGPDSSITSGASMESMASMEPGADLQLHSIDCRSLDDAGITKVFDDVETALGMGGGFILPGEVSGAQAPVLDIPPASPGEGPWNANYMQKDALQALYALSVKIRRRSKPGLLAAWRRLQLSDHFYNMRTGRYSNETSPYSSPYEAYIMYMNILADLSKSAARGR